MVIGALVLHEPFLAKRVETVVSLDDFYVELRAVRTDGKNRLFLSRYSLGGTLRIAFLPDQVDVLIENLSESVTAAHAHLPEQRSSSLLIRIIDFLFPDKLFEKVTPMDFTGGILVVKAETSPNTSSNRSCFIFKGIWALSQRPGSASRMLNISSRFSRKPTLS